MNGPRLKLARSREHLSVLNEEIHVFIQSNTPTVEAELTQKGAYLARVYLPPIPTRFGILAADVFQNLRASLDYLAWELALLNVSDGVPFYDTSFPICKDWSSDTQSRFNKITKSLAQDVRDEIQALQPYRRGNFYKSHPLWVLNFFCNIAKHRSIPMTGTMLNVEMPTSYKVLDASTVEMIFHNPPKGFKPDANWSISFFSGIREMQGITLLPQEVIDLYNFVTDIVFPKFVRFFP